MTTDVSVIVPTYNGVERVGECLDSIFSQSSLPSEVIVVIDGSSDGTDEYLTREYGNKVIIINQKNSGRAATRNAGAKRAKNNLLLFVDDDIKLEPGAIQKHVDHHKSSKNCMLVGGLFLKEEPTDDFHKYRQHIEKKWYKNLPGYPSPMQANKLFVTAANLSIPRKLFKDLDGFDQSLRDCEDIELGYRAVHSGLHVYFDRNIVGWHNDVLTCKQYIKRRREYDAAQHKLAKSNELFSKYRISKKD